MKILKLSLICFSIAFLLPNIMASYCGGDVECKCSDTVNSDYILKNNLNCSEDTALYLLEGVSLDCNNNSISGVGDNIGIKINGYKGTSISNCKLKNFNVALDLGVHYGTAGNGWGAIWQVTYYSENTIIKNNILENNNYGINTDKSKNDLISNNKFINNEFGIVLSSINSDIWDNTFINNIESGIYATEVNNINIWSNIFSGSGIKYIYTSGINFCKNNQSNIYLNNLKGPNCDCIIPLDNFNVNSNVNFCEGNYYLPNGFKLNSNSKLDCKGSQISGDGTNIGISVFGSSGTTINNCSISNYYEGIFYSSLDIKNIYGQYITYISNNNIINNSILFNLKNGIIMTKHNIRGDSKAENIHNSIILAEDYNIYNSIDSPINASFNTWGSNNISEIESKFLNKEKVIYHPFNKINKSNLDLEIKSDGIKLSKNINTNSTKIEFLINKNDYYNYNDISVELLKVKDYKILEKKYLNLNLSKKNNYFTLDWDLEKEQQIHIIVDNENKFIELDKSNNYAKKTYTDNKFYSIQVDTKNSIFENSINSYLKEKLGEEYFIDKINSDILIVIKDYKSNLSENLNLLDFNIFDINKIIEVGQIHSYANNSKKYIEISGVNIESKLSAIKEFIKNKDYFMYTNSLRVIYSNDTNVIGDIDYFYNNLKDITYESNNNELNWIINNILYDNKFKIREFKLPINFENKTYDYIMWRLIPENSLDYQNYVDKDNLPIVMAGGLWSDIKTWKELGTELANKGYEVYLLELSGGENIECENCYNYNYNDLVQTVYPTYINKVLELSGKDKIKYVGHSNGARTALDAISKNKVDSNIFETLVLVAVPGAFSELSFFAKIINKSGNIAIERLNKKGIFHPSIDILAHELESIAGELIYPFIQLSNDKNKISTKLFEQYYMWINSNLDEQPGINVSVDYLSLIYGDVIGLNQNDLIVPVSDEIIIFNNINSSKKRFIETDSLHLGMSNKNEIKSFVESTINKKLFE